MKLVIHDLPSEQADKIIPRQENTYIVSDDGTIKNCIGCFGCWIKTPGQCVIRDNYGDMGELLSKCSELIIVSQCYYGGFSPFVKNVLDRCIPYIHPYFIIKNNEMHHRRRYDNRFELSAYFYGDNITDDEKKTAVELVKANADNLDCIVKSILFGENSNAFGGKV